jgi:hypothetical protein
MICDVVNGKMAIDLCKIQEETISLIQIEDAAISTLDLKSASVPKSVEVQAVPKLR